MQKKKKGVDSFWMLDSSDIVWINNHKLGMWMTMKAMLLGKVTKKTIIKSRNHIIHQPNTLRFLPLFINMIMMMIEWWWSSMHTNSVVWKCQVSKHVTCNLRIQPRVCIMINQKWWWSFSVLCFYTRIVCWLFLCFVVFSVHTSPCFACSGYETNSDPNTQHQSTNTLGHRIKINQWIHQQSWVKASVFLCDIFISWCMVMIPDTNSWCMCFQHCLLCKSCDIYLEYRFW